VPRYAKRWTCALPHQRKSRNAILDIPIANTTCILLGTGTSITQEAVRLLASAGVFIQFSCNSKPMIKSWLSSLPLEFKH